MTTTPTTQAERVLSEMDTRTRLIRRSQQPAGEVYFILNRHRKTAELVDRRAFPCFEMVSAAFHVGFLMSDGFSANGIGRCKNEKDFVKRAEKSNVTVL